MMTRAPVAALCRREVTLVGCRSVMRELCGAQIEREKVFR